MAAADSKDGKRQAQLVRKAICRFDDIKELLEKKTTCTVLFSDLSGEVQGLVKELLNTEGYSYSIDTELECTHPEDCCCNYGCYCGASGYDSDPCNCGGGRYCDHHRRENHDKECYKKYITVKE